MALIVRALENGFAAEITGCQINNLDEEQLEEIKKAWYQHSIIYFPEQVIGLEEQEAFTASLGEFGADPYIEPMKDHPHILELERKADETATNFGAAWHSDWSFQKNPPSATILHSKVIPPVGGDTLFSDNYRAFEALSSPMQEFLKGLTATHSAAFAYSPRGILAKEDESKTRTMKINYDESAEEVRSHPLVRLHPESGRYALFVNPVYTTGIEELNQDEAFAILSFLYTHLQREEFIYRHKWKENTLLMWDNRCVNHLAEGGYDGHHRLMHRSTVKGEIPVC